MVWTGQIKTFINLISTLSTLTQSSSLNSICPVSKHTQQFQNCQTRIDLVFNIQLTFSYSSWKQAKAMQKLVNQAEAR